MGSLKRVALGAALFVCAFGAAAGAASADSLYTTTGLSTLVATGTTATATSGSVTLDGPINVVCSTASLNATVTSNSGTISANITGSSWSSCVLGGFFPTSVSANHSPAWVLSTSATSNPYEGQVTGVDVTVASTQFTGDLVDSSLGGSGTVNWDNNRTASGAIELTDAGTLYDGSGNPAYITGAFALQGSAASWTIG
jgi:hypothetical protein